MGSSSQSEPREWEPRQRQLEEIVAASVAEVEEALLKPYRGFHLCTFFGAMGIDPVHLAIWCFFAKDDDLARAKETGFTERIEDAIRLSLKKHCYPEVAIPSIGVAFATDEEVQRDCGGNYWHFLK